MKYLLIFLLAFFIFSDAFAVNDSLNIRDTTNVTIGGNAEHDSLSTFIYPVLDFFYIPTGNNDAIQNTFIAIA